MREALTTLKLVTCMYGLHVCMGMLKIQTEDETKKENGFKIITVTITTTVCLQEFGGGTRVAKFGILFK